MDCHKYKMEGKGQWKETWNGVKREMEGNIKWDKKFKEMLGEMTWKKTSLSWGYGSSV